MENNKLQHAGIKGMKWGIRRFQNKDGSLTPEGKKRYNYDSDSDADDQEHYRRAKMQEEHNKQQRMLKIGAAACATALAAVGVYAYFKSKNSAKVKKGKSAASKIYETVFDGNGREGIRMDKDTEVFWSGMDELQHAGIKGMRWGVRRFQNKDGSLTPEGKKRYADKTDDKPDDTHEDYAKAHNPQSVKTMSNKELQDRLNRLRNEQQYIELTSTKKGENAFAKAAKEIGGNLLKEYAKKAASGLVQAAIESAANKSPKTKKTFETLNWVNKEQPKKKK